MHVESTTIPGVMLIEPRVFRDPRGAFYETYHAERFAAAGIDAPFVQDNHSESKRGVLRGLHYQIQQPQGKLLRVVQGEIFDVAVDLRKSSAAFGKWFGVRLAAGEPRQIYIPPGCAHGFYVLSETAHVHYKCTDFYSPQHERTLLWSDPSVGVQWPLTGEPLLSGKDRAGLPLTAAETYA